MKSPEEQPEARGEANTHSDEGATYEPPHIEVIGRVEEMTLGSLGSKADGLTGTRQPL
jgi:hypothetical protein